MALEIREVLAPKGTSARTGRKLDGFLGVTIHETANTAKGAGATAHANYLKNDAMNLKKSWHYCVDDRMATRSIPEDEVSLHSGTTKGNYNTISIEICVNSDGDFRKAVQNAAELTADILKRRKVTESNFQKYLYKHNDWSGKDCPHCLRSGKPVSWAFFVSEVLRHLKGTGTASGGFSVGDSVILNGYLYVDSYASIKGKYMTNKKAKITKIAPDSNLRKAPFLLDGGLGWVRGEDLAKQR